MENLVTESWCSLTFEHHATSIAASELAAISATYDSVGHTAVLEAVTLWTPVASAANITPV